MIIPLIQIDQLEDRSEDAVLALAVRWSLFGKLAVRGDQADTETIKRMIHRLGHVDIQLHLSSGGNTGKWLEMLNEGASEVVVTPAQATAARERIPAARLIQVQSDWPPADGDDLGLLIVPFPPERISAGGFPGARPVSIGDGKPIRVQMDAGWADHLRSLDDQNIDVLVDHRTLEANPDRLSEAVHGLLRSDRPDDLVPTVVVDALGTALGLAYSNRQSLTHAITHRQGVYWSRSRQGLWIKGATSGATQQLLEIGLDCDRDCLRFTVEQRPPGFCHRDTYTCFGNQRSIQSVIGRLADRIRGDDTGSFTRKLANDSQMLETKLLEEARELAEATDHDDIRWEAADLLYFSLVRMIDRGVSLDEVHSELARRMNRVVRRKNKLEPGNEPR